MPIPLQAHQAERDQENNNNRNYKVNTMKIFLHTLPFVLISIFCTLIFITAINTFFNWIINFETLAQSVSTQPQPAPEFPKVFDANLKIERVYTGPAFPTNIAFIDQNDILLLEKNTGQIIRIKDGKNMGPVLNLQVSTKDEMGLLGITTAISKEADADNQTQNIFLYYTHCISDTDCNNFVYRYIWDNRQGNLTHPFQLLKLPALPGPSHQGGDITVGPDGYLYIAIGDMTPTKLFNKDKRYETKAQNYQDGQQPDGRAGILRITQDGKPVDGGIIGASYPLNLYYAYGIKNSFGIGFDPLTGNLWDTENGPSFGDEINLIKPGFNGGWNKVQGFWRVDNTSQKMEMIKGEPTDLVTFGDKGKYSEPKFVWDKPVAPTALVFMNSDKLGKQYLNDMLVGSVKDGRIFHFKLDNTTNNNRTELSLPGSVHNKIMTKENLGDMQSGINFASGFGIITDLAVGPHDGYLYIISGDKNPEVGSIYRITPVKSTLLLSHAS